jgi:hydroxymethylpyrimidine/phosphomethylpyrimidine kinase
MRISSIDDARTAAVRIRDLGPAAILIKGGHGAGPDLVDLLFDDGVFTELETARLDTRHTHGTGCTLASAIAAYLALGRTLVDATADAQQYVAGAIAHAPGLGKGNGPLHHFWRFREKTVPAL